MKYARYYFYTFVLAFAACGSDDSAVDEPQPPTDNRQEVNILTRTDEPGQGESLQAGLYMVNYVNGLPDVLLGTNNYVNNHLLTWTNSGWTTSTPIYWNDSETKADFYGYAPYQATVDDAHQLTFSIQTDQRTAAAFAQSDFLWGKVEGQSPNAGDFNLTLKHILCQLTVTVTAEAGFDDNELQANDVSVIFGGSKTCGTIDLSTGTVEVSGTANDVKLLSNGELTYKAVLLPQIVPFSNLIQVNWKGNVYTLQNSYRLEAGRQYNITVRLKKTKSGFDVGIAGWDIIGEDFGGTLGGN